MRSTFLKLTLCSALVAIGLATTIYAHATPPPWPNTVIPMPLSVHENAYMNDPECLQYEKCFSFDVFEKAIKKDHPDIAKMAALMKFKGDSVQVRIQSLQFVLSSYYAKRIVLANGVSLFDFMKKCAKEIPQYPRSALLADSRKADSASILINYSPILIRKFDDSEIKMNIYFERTRTELSSNTGIFSSSMLTEPDFMALNGLRCNR